MSITRCRTILGISTYASVVTSPATTTRPVVTSASTATRLCGSLASIASRTESLIWSAILSGCPSVTDSEVNSLPAMSSLVFLVCGGSPRGEKLPSVTGGHGRVPNLVRQQILAAGQRSDRLGTAENGDLAVGPAEHLARADLVEYQQVTAFAGQLGLAELDQALLRPGSLGGEPDQHLPGIGAGSDQTGEDVGRLRQVDAEPGRARLL